MLLKSADDKAPSIDLLEELINSAPTDKQSKIKRELCNLRAGVKGESESAYHIDFFFKKPESWIVIHDLRLEVDDRVAQIDHLLINRHLDCYVLESKHFHAGLKINEDGEFMRWNNFDKKFEGMASPLAQNARHIAVFKDAVAKLEMPLRNGARLEPLFHSVVLISPDARIDRPEKRDTSAVVKADQLYEYVLKRHQTEDGPSTGNPIDKPIYRDSLEDIGHTLIALHVTIAIDYAAKFQLDAKPAIDSVIAPEPADDSSGTVGDEAGTDIPLCKQCRSDSLSVQYGKFGYYFKCAACQANTAIRVSCGHDGHKERIRKDGLMFYRECPDCKTSSLFFTNPA